MTSKLLPGKFVWFEHVSKEPKRAQAFYGEVLGWKVSPFPVGDDSYDMIASGDAMLGGYDVRRAGDGPARWRSVQSVASVDDTARAVVAAGGKVIEPPSDMPQVGRFARIADPLGAELALITSVTDDPPDAPATHGRFFWNELHTRDASKSAAFCQQALGFAVRAQDMGPSGTYHILSQGGVDRGGITSHGAGEPSFWLPYVFVDDADAALARALRHGGKPDVPASDIPGIGRFAVFTDPLGATLAVMKPAPMPK